MKLKFAIKKIEEITESQKDEMFNLMVTHYENVYLDDFLSDLAAKQWVILLLSEQDAIVGFSTQVIYIPKETSDFKNCIVLFSGDTIISFKNWGSLILPIAFLHLVKTIQQIYPNKKLFWMLVSKGLRTYKYLSVFLKEYYPCHFTPTPEFIKALMFYMGTLKYGDNYNSVTGLIKSDTKSQFLKETYQPEERSENPVARFFYSCNPEYSKGDELLCMAEIASNNLQPYIRQVLDRYV